MKKIRYLSLFSGIGGFELGIQSAYESNTKHAHISSQSQQKKRAQGRQRSLNLNRVLLHARDGTTPLCIGFSEIDKYATQIYSSHFPEHKPYGDITKINADELPDFDLLCGGFPCQSFSIAGKRGGFSDTRGTMFFEIARILKAKQPRLLLLENVKGLLSHDQGKTFATIISTLDELGYDLQWQVLNSKDFDVPQNRERVFIIGHLRGTGRPEVFPFGENGQQTDELSRHVTNTLTARYEGAQAVGTYIGEGELDAQVRETEDGFHSFRNDKKKSSIQGTHVTYPKGKSHALSTAHIPMTLEDSQIRRLTPTECERLQGFPDNWTSSVSDTQRYKCCGNAVTVNVIQAIMEKLLI